MRRSVLHLLPALSVGGAEWMAAELAAASADEFSPLVAVLGSASSTPVESYLRQCNIPVVHLDKPRGPSALTALRVLGLVERLRPFVIHTHQYALKYALPAGRLLRTPIVHTLHNLAGVEVSKLDRFVHRWAFRGAVYPVAIARAVDESFREIYGSRPAAVIPNGIRTEAFSSTEREEWRRGLGVGPRELLVTCVGRLVPQKNHGLLLRAFAKVGPQAGARLLLVGDGPLRGELEAQADRLGVRGFVEFLGVRADVPRILAASDVFTLASDWEGNPLSVMEAMAAGLPVVATDVGGVAELVLDGETGLVVPAGDVVRFAEALGSLLEAHEMRGRLGVAGARIAREVFDVSTMSRRYAELYRSVGEKPAW